MATKAVAVRPTRVTIVQKARRAGRRISDKGIPLGLVMAVVPGVMHFINGSKTNWKFAVNEVFKVYTGFSFFGGEFNTAWLKYGLWPAMGGVALHYVVGERLGVNRFLRKSGIPLIRI